MGLTRYTHLTQEFKTTPMQRRAGDFHMHCALYNTEMLRSQNCSWQQTTSSSSGDLRRWLFGHNEVSQACVNMQTD